MQRDDGRALDGRQLVDAATRTAEHGESRKRTGGLRREGRKSGLKRLCVLLLLLLPALPAEGVAVTRVRVVASLT
jgi:hypothetical protein